MIAEAVLNEVKDYIEDQFAEVSPFRLEKLAISQRDYYGDTVEDDVYDWALETTDFSLYGMGCTKLVLKTEAYPQFVFKIPFNKLQTWDEGGEEIIWDSDYSCAGNGLNIDTTAEHYDSWDYCSVEEIVYQAALAADVEKAFAETCYVTEISGVKFYISQCIDGAYSYSGVDRFVSEKDRSDAETSQHAFNLGTSLFSAMVCSWGINYAEKVANFIQDIGLDDLHGENWKWDNNNTVRIIDYSDYSEE